MKSLKAAETVESEGGQEEEALKTRRNHQIRREWWVRRVARVVE